MATDPRAPEWVDELRRRGTMSAHVDEIHCSPDEWRKRARRAARGAELKVRTYWRDPMIFVDWLEWRPTEAHMGAMRDAMEDRYHGRPARPFEERLEANRRKLIRAVPDPGPVEEPPAV